MIKRAVAAVLTVLGTAGPVWAACDSISQVDIYPTAAVLPENLLRIYINFPHPMDRDVGVPSVRLLDQADNPVDGAFLTNREDLWSPDRRRLTLLMNPGRVKSGLDAHEELGRALVLRQAYAIEVSGAALDADVCPLGQDARHEFTVTSADFQPPQPADWQLSMPQASSKQPLEVALSSAQDHLSLAFRLRVMDTHGDIVPGAVSLGANEASWRFTPSIPWATTSYSLEIDERLEDLAGNRPGLLFDQPMDQAPLPWENSLAFTPRQ